MIERANLCAKPVIVGTHMLESMVRNAKPTRGEASDVASTVLDGADCLMLCRETSAGVFPLNSVSFLAKICTEAERMVDHRRVYNDLRLYTGSLSFAQCESVAAAACSSVLDLSIDLIVVLTETGKIARMVAKYRPEVPILACSISMPIVRQLNTSRGVIVYKIPSF